MTVSVTARAGQSVTYAYDASGNVTGLVGPGGRLVNIPMRGPITVIPFGDSLTQNTAAFTNGLWQFGRGYAELAIYGAGGPFQIVRNAGISGNTTTQMLARLSADVLSYKPAVVMLLGGTNDLSSAMADSVYTTMMNNLESMVLQMLKLNILPVIVTPPVKNSAALESRKAQWFYYALAQYYGLPLLDLYRLTVDAATGNYLAGYSGDGTHPGTTGLIAIGPAASDVLTNYKGANSVPYMAAYSETSANNFANLIRNGSFAQQAAPPAPDGWTIDQTNGSYTVPAATQPYTGDSFTYVKTNTNTLYALIGAGPTVAGSGFSVGDTLQFSGRVSTSNITLGNGFTLGMDMVGASGSVQPFAAFPYNGDFVFAHQFVVPAGVTGMTPTLQLQDAGTYQVSNLTLINVTNANAIWQPGVQI